MAKLVSELNHEDLLMFREIVEKEIKLSETAISEGLEEENYCDNPSCLIKNCDGKH